MSETTENTLSSYLGPEFQQRLMWQLLVEPEFAEKTMPNLAIEYFDDPNLKRLYIIMLEYMKENAKVPNLQNQSIYQAINQYKSPNNTIEEESLFAVIEKIKLWNERIINKQLLYDGDAVQHQTTDFIKQQEYRKIAEGIIFKCKNGEIRKKQAIAKIEEDFQKVAHIGDEEDYGIDIFDNIDHALRKEFRQTIPTGIFAIDTLTGGGLGKGEIGVILTPSGVGKTTALTVIANSAYDDCRNVCQIIFEDTKEQIQRKHFAIWAKSALSKMDEPAENLRVNKVAHQKASEMVGKGKLIVKRFSQENTTMMDVRKWMIGYQKKYGFKFDILILDYLDCLEPHKKSSDRNEAELVIIKGFEALAADFDIPAWTAIQTNRSGFNAEYVEAYQTGGSIKRIQKAHFFMSVAKTKDQQEASLANIRIIKARFAKDGQAFDDCIFNNDTMQIIIEDKRYPLQAKGMKHHDTEDVNTIDETAKKLLEKSSDWKIHEAISKNVHTEGSLMGRLNDPSINDYIPDKEAPIDINQFVPKIENIHISTTQTDLTETEIKKIVDIANDVLKENEGISEGTNEGISEGVNNNELLDLEDTPIIHVGNDAVNDGVSEGVNDGVSEGVKKVIETIRTEIGEGLKKNFFTNEPFDWNGESGSTTNEITNQPEVKLEDIQPPKIITEDKPIEKIQGIAEKLMHASQNNIRNIQEAVKTFNDPDLADNHANPIFEAIKKLERHQNVVKKE